MNKTKIYQEISKLFPSTLGVGDVVECLSGLGQKIGQATIYEVRKDAQGNIWYETSKGSFTFEHLKLFRKNITAEDILKMFQTVRKFHTTLELSNKGYLTYWESTTDLVKQEDWILGKPLYDQSEKLIRLAWEVLK